MERSLAEARSRQDLREAKFLTAIQDRLDCGELSERAALDLLRDVERSVLRGGPKVVLFALILVCEDNVERCIRLWQSPETARYWRSISKIVAQALAPASRIP
jgi:hypothetical protein